MHSTSIITLLLGLTSASVLPRQSPTRTMIPNTVFNSQNDFNTDFNYQYPWGSDHNGAARMDKAQASLFGGVLTLTARPVTGQPPARQSIPIKYLSGAVHAKEKFTVSKTGGYDFYAEFKATTTKGTWPAFWLTGANGWPPEIDLAEWKGSGKISFNTFNTSSQVSTKDVTYPSPGNWHTIKAEVRDLNGKDIQTKFFMDGGLVTTQVGRGYVGQPQWLIINLQMEGSSGAPGPTTSPEVAGYELQSVIFLFGRGIVVSLALGDFAWAAHGTSIFVKLQTHLHIHLRLCVLLVRIWNSAGTL